MFADALEKYDAGASREEVEEIIKTGAPRDYFVASSQICGRLDKLYAHAGPAFDESTYSILQFADVPDPVWAWYSKYSLVSVL